MISTYDRDILKLIERSPDRGNGWKTVSQTCWPLIERFGTTELIEVDRENERVRFTDAGMAVVSFAI